MMFSKGVSKEWGVAKKATGIMIAIPGETYLSDLVFIFAKIMQLFSERSRGGRRAVVNFSANVAGMLL